MECRLFGVQSKCTVCKKIFLKQQEMLKSVSNYFHLAFGSFLNIVRFPKELFCLTWIHNLRLEFRPSTCSMRLPLISLLVPIISLFLPQMSKYEYIPMSQCKFAGATFQIVIITSQVAESAAKIARATAVNTRISMAVKTYLSFKNSTINAIKGKTFPFYWSILFFEYQVVIIMFSPVFAVHIHP